MGGPGAPDDLDAGAVTQVWLATSNDPEVMISGQYFNHQKRRAAEPAARDEEIQERLIAECTQISGMPFSESRDPQLRWDVAEVAHAPDHSALALGLIPLFPHAGRLATDGGVKRPRARRAQPAAAT